MLQDIYLFKDLDKKELAEIEKIAKEKSYTSGQDIFVAGSKAEALYIVKMGSVKINATGKDGDEVKIATFGTGSHFGEMPFLDNEKRSATAQAIESSSIVEIKYADLKNVIAANEKIALKIYKALATFLGRRLRVTTEDLHHAREREHNLRHF